MDPNAYDAQANKLINMFIENFKKFEADVDEKIKSSGPIIN
jgi:phosphoenolpyruvate carboxykinase (ATP)